MKNDIIITNSFSLAPLINGHRTRMIQDNEEIRIGDLIWMNAGTFSKETLWRPINILDLPPLYPDGRIVIRLMEDQMELPFE